MSGYIGKIVRINLTTGDISYIDTAGYTRWGGGHGIGSALFYDIAIREKGLDLENMDHNSLTDGGFHPENVITLMTSPFVGAGVPSASGRCEVQGIGVQPYPIGWFTRSNFGGRFSSMLKYAGYDGLVIEGASPVPVWIDIRDKMIAVRRCSELGLWGLDTVETQQVIFDYINGKGNRDKWSLPGQVNLRTTQRPAIVTIGKAGENRSRMACLIHDASNAAGQGGFGGIWGSKNLKAISVIGTGGVPVADPRELLSVRLWQKENYEFNAQTGAPRENRTGVLRHYSPPGSADLWGITPAHHMHSDGVSGMMLRMEEGRTQSCIGCLAGCRGRWKSGEANEANCMATVFYGDAETQSIQQKAVDLANRYGFNTYELYQGLPYLKAIWDKGILGRGAQVPCELDFSDYGSLDFASRFLKTIADRDTYFGDTLAEGFPRALERWGRLQDIGDHTAEDQAHVMLPYWGYPEHDYDSRCELEWGYGSILGDRDINEHGFNSMYWDNALNNAIPFLNIGSSTAEVAVDLFTEKMVPHNSAYATREERMQMLNYGTENMYSVHIARFVSWHRHYSRFYKQSLLFCDWKYPDIINVKQPDLRGSTPEAEPKYIKAVTGNDISFEEGMAIGRKIWNLDNAIWVMQGRHRDMVQFADYLYENDFPGHYEMPTYDPSVAVYRRWDFRDVSERHFDRTEFENFKTHYYTVEGWDTATGWPTRATLEELDLSDVANTLGSLGKL